MKRKTHVLGMQWSGTNHSLQCGCEKCNNEFDITGYPCKETACGRNSNHVLMVDAENLEEPTCLSCYDAYWKARDEQDEQDEAATAVLKAHLG